MLITLGSQRVNRVIFQLSAKSDPRLRWFCVNPLCDWSRKLAPLSQPMTCKTKTNHDLVARVFPRFRQFAFFL